MIRGALNEEGIPPLKYLIIPVPDTDGEHAVWVSRVKQYTPRFDLVFSNDPLTKRLFKEAGYEVYEVPLLKRHFYSGTEVRRRMLAGEDWKSLVPRFVAKYIEEIRGVERIKELAGLAVK